MTTVQLTETAIATTVVVELEEEGLVNVADDVDVIEDGWDLVVVVSAGVVVIAVVAVVVVVLGVAPGAKEANEALQPGLSAYRRPSLLPT